MKKIAISTIMTLILSVHFSAHADERIDGLKKMNADGCVEAIKFEKHAPTDTKQVKPYCTCVYDAYYDGFTPAEQRQIVSGGIPPGKLKESLPARLEATKEQCRKKIGF